MIPPGLLVHSATVEPYAGSGAYGDTWGAPIEGVPCYAEQQSKLVRDSQGDEVVSGTQVFTDPAGSEFTRADGTTGTVPAAPPGSKVTVLGVTSRVVTVAVFDDGGLTGLAHQEVDLA